VDPKTATPSILVGTYPTPLEPLAQLSRPGSALWVKRDDLTHPLYGGNKVRKLERILVEARRSGASRLVTVGAVGSHHVLATAIFGAQAGFEVEAVLTPQPRTAHVVQNLRVDLAFHLHPYPARSYAAAALAIAGRIARGSYYIPVGGSSVTGAMGYVEAARELAEQVRRGEMPEPDVAVVTLGSGGTAGGLAAGLALAGLKTRLIAVCVTDPPWAIALAARFIAWRCLERSDGPVRDLPSGRLVIERGYIGAGYGHPTPRGERAIDVASSVGLHLDPTYTAKAFAAALDLVARGDAKTILYWHTLSSAPLGPLLLNAGSEDALAPELLRLLQ
jgi:1-aminocyclopropane-1-carboxylate deaminase/D-cysteine desulfhydrase-like pyridoxal-dependent ACC family enzyme